MGIATSYFVEDDPMLLTQPRDSTSVARAGRQTQIAVVAPFPIGDLAFGCAANPPGFTMTPRQKQCLRFLVHLTLQIDRNRVVVERRRERVMPRRRCAHTVRPRIERDIDTSPPEIDVQLIGVARRMPKFCRPDECKSGI